MKAKHKRTTSDYYDSMASRHRTLAITSVFVYAVIAVIMALVYVMAGNVDAVIAWVINAGLAGTLGYGLRTWH